MKIISKINTNQSENNEYPIGHIFNLYDIKLIVKEGAQCRYCFGINVHLWDVQKKSEKIEQI